MRVCVCVCVKTNITPRSYCLSSHLDKRLAVAGPASLLPKAARVEVSVDDARGGLVPQSGEGALELLIAPPLLEVP